MKQISLLILSVAIPLFASCTQEENHIPEPAAAGVPLRVATVALAGEEPEATTRATVLPVPITVGKLSVGVRGKNNYTAQKGLIYTYGSGTWTSATPLTLVQDTVSLYAYWPQDEYALAADTTVSLLTQPYAATKDLSYALSGGDNVCSVHPYAGFILRHAYSRLIVEISFSPQLDGTTVLDSVTVAATGLLSTGKQNIENGTFTVGDPATELKWKPGVALSTLGNTYNGYKYTGDLLVVPSKSLSDGQFTISLGGVDYISDLSSELLSMEAGKRYRIRAVLGSSLIIDKVEMDEWVETSPENGDTRYETGIPPEVNESTNMEEWIDNSSTPASGDTQLE